MKFDVPLTDLNVKVTNVLHMNSNKACLLLSTEIRSWLSDFLNSTTSCIVEVWLIGSRVNNRWTEKSDWDFIFLLEEENDINDIARLVKFHREDVDLFVVTDGNFFKRVWGEKKTGSFSSWCWKNIDLRTATYTSASWEKDLDVDEVPHDISCNWGVTVHTPAVTAGN